MSLSHSSSEARAGAWLALGLGLAPVAQVVVAVPLLSQVTFSIVVSSVL